jgi:hypothetical protein
VGSFHNTESSWFLGSFPDVCWAQNPFTPGLYIIQVEICLRTRVCCQSDWRQEIFLEVKQFDILTQFCRGCKLSIMLYLLRFWARNEKGFIYVMGFFSFHRIDFPMAFLYVHVGYGVYPRVGVRGWINLALGCGLV